jgi:hypothetical protein
MHEQFFDGPFALGVAVVVLAAGYGGKKLDRLD